MLAGLVLARNWGIDLGRLMADPSATVRIVRGLFSVVVIALFADLVWFVFKAMLERKLAEMRMPLVESGRIRVSVREADDLLRDAEAFLARAELVIGLPARVDPTPRLAPVRSA